MELKIVKRPFQGHGTRPEDIQFSGENWQVKTYIYRERDGGMNLWLKDIKNINPDIVYLYGINTILDNEEIYYRVRCDFRKN